MLDDLVPEDTLSQINRIQDAMKERLLPLQERGVYLRDQPDVGQSEPKGKVQMFYLGSRFSKSGKGAVSQVRELQWLVAIYLRDLRTLSEIYPIEQAVWALLTGWKPDECLYPGLLYPIESRLEEERNKAGYWIVDLIVGLQMQHEGIE